MFKVGDMVVLNSGGPSMKIVCISPDSGYVFCEWKAKDGGWEGASFPPVCVTPLSKMSKEKFMA